MDGPVDLRRAVVVFTIATFSFHAGSYPYPGTTEENRNFAARPVPDVHDVTVSMISGLARPGMPLEYVITIENIGTVATSGTLIFAYDPVLQFTSAIPSQSRHSGAIVEWDFTDLPSEQSRTYRVYLNVPVSAAIDDRYCASARIRFDGPDLSIHHRDTTCIKVTRSHDPNDIAVAPFGIEENGEITPVDSILTYTIRFQNTGNDTAFKVVVVDSLSPHLDITTITPGAASHPFSFVIDGGGILTWTFDNILLPDSNASEPNSHGFFKYTIRQRRDLASGTRIPNRVEIYFDYNAPVATNTVVSIIGTPSSVPVTADASAMITYPNPAKGMVHLRGDDRG